MIRCYGYEKKWYMMNKVIMMMFIMLFLVNGIFSNARDKVRNREVSRMFYSDPYFSLMKGMKKSAKKHAVYSYIISNLTTVDFDYMAFLPPSDQAALSRIYPENEAFDRKLITEFLMTRMAENSKRSQLFMALYKGRKDSLSRIVTMGK